MPSALAVVKDIGHSSSYPGHLLLSTFCFKQDLSRYENTNPKYCIHSTRCRLPRSNLRLRKFSTECCLMRNYVTTHAITAYVGSESVTTFPGLSLLFGGCRVFVPTMISYQPIDNDVNPCEVIIIWVWVKAILNRQKQV